MTIVKCDYCGKEFYKHECYLKRTKSNFCSSKCFYENQHTNKFILFNELAILRITKQDGKEIDFLIDTDDVKFLKKYHWRVRYTRKLNNYYAETGKGKNRLILHRLLTNCPDGLVVDHINHNTIDNRKCNLKVCTYGENMINRYTFKNNKLGEKNISYKQNRYCVRFFRDKKEIYIGSFATLKAAIDSRNKYLESEKCY